jgi:hypothetical protein
MPKISELSPATSLVGSEPIPADQGISTVSITPALLASYMVATMAGVGVPNNLVKYDSLGRYPAADGSQITNLNAIVLDNLGRYPAHDGSLITNLNAILLDSSGRYPAHDGSLITSLNGIQVTGKISIPIDMELGTPISGLSPSTIQQAIRIFQSYNPVTLSTPETYNAIGVNDSYVTDPNFLSVLSISHALTTGFSGNRNTFAVDLRITGKPSGNASNICAGFFNCSASGIDAGGAHIFAFNPQCYVGPGTSNLPHMQVGEINLSIAAGVTSVDRATCLAFVPNNAAGASTVRANLHTAAQIFYSEAGVAGFSELFLIGNWDPSNQSPFGVAGAQGGSIMTCVGSPSIKFGIDLRGAVPVGTDLSAGYPFASPGITIDWTGAVSGNVFTSTGANGGYVANDRSTSGYLMLYRDAGVGRLFDSVLNAVVMNYAAATGIVSFKNSILPLVGTAAVGSAASRWHDVFITGGAYQIDNVPVLQNSGGYTQLASIGGGGVILMGPSSGDTSIHYRHTTHYFENSTGATQFASLNAGGMALTGGISAGSISANLFVVGSFTFATLPAAPAAGFHAYITDGAASLAWGANAAGGGTTKYFVWYNGTAWTVIGK